MERPNTPYKKPRKKHQPANQEQWELIDVPVINVRPYQFKEKAPPQSPTHSPPPQQYETPRCPLQNGTPKGGKEVEGFKHNEGFRGGMWGSLGCYKDFPGNLEANNQNPHKIARHDMKWP